MRHSRMTHCPNLQSPDESLNRQLAIANGRGRRTVSVPRSRPTTPGPAPSGADRARRSRRRLAVPRRRRTPRRARGRSRPRRPDPASGCRRPGASSPEDSAALQSASTSPAVSAGLVFVCCWSFCSISARPVRTAEAWRSMSRLEGTPWISATVRRGRSRLGLLAGLAAAPRRRDLHRTGAAGALAAAFFAIGAGRAAAFFATGFRQHDLALRVTALRVAALRAAALRVAALRAAAFAGSRLAGGLSVEPAWRPSSRGRARFRGGLPGLFRRLGSAPRRGRGLPGWLSSQTGPLSWRGRAAFFLAMAVPFGSLTVRAKYA